MAQIYRKPCLLLLAISAACLGFSQPLQAQQNAIYDDEPSLTGSFLAGQFARTSGDIRGAIHYLKKVSRQQPDDIEVTGQLVSLLLLDGQVKEASLISSKLSNEYEKDPLLVLIRILHDLKTNNISAASRSVDQAFESGVGQLWLPLVSSWIDVVQSPPSEPVTMQQLSGNLNRSVPILHYHLALINDYAGFHDAAAQNFKDAIENPKNPPLRLMEQLIQFYQRSGSPAVLKLIVEDYLANHPEMAASKKTEKFDLQSGVAEVLFSMGSVMRVAGITHDAVVYLQLALYLKPELQVARVALGDSYNDIKMPDRANAIYAKIPSGDRHFDIAQIKYAVNLERMNDLPAALRHLDRLSKNKSIATQALITKGDLLRMHGRFAESADAYTHVLNGLNELGKDDWTILFARAVSYDRLDKWEDAENDLLKALVLNSDQPDILNYLGFAWLMRGIKVDEASQMIEKALAARPNDPHIIDSMGWSLYLRGRYADAATYMERAVALLPSDPTVNDHLGDIYWRLGRKTEARYQWQRSLSFNPDQHVVDMIERKLQDGLSSTEAKKLIVPVIAAGQNVNTNVLP